MTADAETRSAARARARGDLPRAPMLTGGAAVLGGLGGLLAAAPALARTARGLCAAAFTELDAAAALQIAWPALVKALIAPALGALLGLVAAQLALGALALRPRWRRVRGAGGRAARPGALGAVLGLGVLFCAPVLALPALAFIPGLLPAPDAGHLLLRAAPVALAVAAAALLVPALVQRHRARTEWLARHAPEPPPRRDPEEASPEVRAAVRAASAAVTTGPARP